MLDNIMLFIYVLFRRLIWITDIRFVYPYGRLFLLFLFFIDFLALLRAVAAITKSVVSWTFFYVFDISVYINLCLTNGRFPFILLTKFLSLVFHHLLSRLVQTISVVCFLYTIFYLTCYTTHVVHGYFYSALHFRPYYIMFLSKVIMIRLLSVLVSDHVSLAYVTAGHK